MNVSEYLAIENKKQGVIPSKFTKSTSHIVLFLLIFLQTDAKGQSAADHHLHPVTSSSYAVVKW